MDAILVTGGAGYIGSHTVVELISSGFKVIIVDNFHNSSPRSIDGIAAITGVKPLFVEADCTDYAAMEKLFKQYRIIGTIHFAAYKAVYESVEKPVDYYENNLQSTLTMLRLLNEFEGRYFVFSGSCTVYGQPDKLPVTEQSPLKPPLSPYGNTKRIAEEIIRDTVSAHSAISAIVLRYFNPIGAHPSALIGELPSGKPDNLIPFITQTAAGIRDKLQIFGNDYDTPDGTPIRDYFHVVDLAKAHVKALNRLIENKNTTPLEFFNVGAGRGITVLEIVKAFERVTGIRVPYEIVGRRPGDIEKVWADTYLAEKLLGWKAVSSLEDALLTAWNWECKLREGKG